VGHALGESTAPGQSWHADARAAACPLCGFALAEEQDWCLRCGAAARTRVASTPRWQPPLVLLLVLAALCLAVLAGALVKLARGAGPTPAPITTTITAASATPGATTPTATTTTGASTGAGR
jgi:hypothetical protein